MNKLGIERRNMADEVVAPIRDQSNNKPANTAPTMPPTSNTVERLAEEAASRFVVSYIRFGNQYMKVSPTRLAKNRHTEYSTTPGILNASINPIAWSFCGTRGSHSNSDVVKSEQDFAFSIKFVIEELEDDFEECVDFSC